MPNGLNNWGYRDVTNFLKKHSFNFWKEREGSHEAWISEDEKYVVEVNFIKGKKSYPPRTLETMIGQSGITKEEWKEWAKRGGK